MVLQYDAGKYQLGAICRLEGSVFPQACFFGVPAFLLALAFGWIRQEEATEFELAWLKYSGTYGSFTVILGFLVVFRNQVAYQRFWEGATLAQVLRGQWVVAFGSILSFTAGSEASDEEIYSFRMRLIRLFSALHACTLDHIYEEGDGTCPIIGVEGFDEQTLKLMHVADDEALVYVHVQWIQQMIMCAMDKGVIPTPAPIVSRVFQDLSQGVVTINNAKKISDTPFPFPYCQALQTVLLLHTILAPFFCVLWIQSPVPAAIYAFIIVTVLHMLNFISAEIENPYGTNPNDLDRLVLQDKFNRTLVTMSSPSAIHIPKLQNVSNDLMTLPTLYQTADNYSNAWSTVSGGKVMKVHHTENCNLNILFDEFNVAFGGRMTVVGLSNTPSKEHDALKLIGEPHGQAGNVLEDASGGNNYGEDITGNDETKKMKKKVAPRPLKSPSNRPVGTPGQSGMQGVATTAPDEQDMRRRLSEPEVVGISSVAPDRQAVHRQLTSQ